MIWSIRRPNSSIKQSFIDEFDKNILGFIMWAIVPHLVMVFLSIPMNILFNDILGIGFQFNYMFLDLVDWLLVFAFVAIMVIGVEFFKYIAASMQFSMELLTKSDVSEFVK